MSYDDEELKEFKRQVDRRLLRWGSVGVNFVAWLVGCGILAIVDAAAIEIIATAWFGLLILHGMLVWMWEKRDRDIAAEVARREQLRGSEKLKHDRLYRLADDGELVEVEDDADQNVALSDIHR